MTSTTTKFSCLGVFTVVFLPMMLLLSCNKSDDAPNSTFENPTSQGLEEPRDNLGGIDSPASPVLVNGDLSDITSDFILLSSFYGWEGAQIAITRNGKLIYLESFGEADAEKNIPVNNESLFRIGSISKPITVLAISKLVAENKLNLQSRVFGQNSILGDEYGTQPYEADIEKITVSDLLEHRAGFTDDPTDIMFEDIALTHDEIIGKVLDERSLTHPPGEKYVYSNFGFSLLGRIIEKITDQTYENYVRDFVLGAAGISDMRIGRNTKEEAYDNEVSYYSDWSPPYKLNVKRMDSHGGWISSAKSLAMLALKTDGNISVPDLLGRNQGLSYLALGRWNHNGALPGTTAVMSVGYPLSYVVLINNGDQNYMSTLRNIGDFMEGKLRERNDWPTDDLIEFE
jgi:CubicO group peptidase (beta-lactamase class C family)